MIWEAAAFVLAMKGSIGRYWPAGAISPQASSRPKAESQPRFFIKPCTISLFNLLFGRGGRRAAAVDDDVMFEIIQDEVVEFEIVDDAVDLDQPTVKEVDIVPNPLHQAPLTIREENFASNSFTRAYLI